MREAAEKFLLEQGFIQSTLDMLDDDNLQGLAQSYLFEPFYAE